MTLGEAADRRSQIEPNGGELHAPPGSIEEECSNHLLDTDGSTGRESFSSALSTQSSSATLGSALNAEKSIRGSNAADTTEDRGRTLEQVPRYENPLARAESRACRADAVIGLNSTPIGKRISRSSTFFENPTDPSAVLDDDLLEPCPHILPCANVSEVLSDSAADPSYALFADPDHASVKVKPVHSPSSSSLETSPPRSHQPCRPRSSASQLPGEILQQIYYNLSPTDFNSARHACRSWLINSLEPFVLDEMLQRGGFASSTQHDLTTNHVISLSKNMVNDEWLKSKHLSRECALGPDWKGSGVSEPESYNNSAFAKTATVDFTEISVPNIRTRSSGTLFTISSCGKFLLTANGCLIYVYELNKTPGTVHDPGSLRPITSIICPARVLACSMDTSSRRYAIAVLLEGRKGMVCEVTLLKRKSKDRTIPSSFQDCPSNVSQDANQVNNTPILDQVSLIDSAHSQSQQFVFPGIASTGLREDPQWQDVLSEDTALSAQTSGPNSRQVSMTRVEVLKQTRVDKLPATSSDAQNSRDRCFMPIEDGPRSFYRNICSEDDPPRSVAICPQRRCVAFGCSSGIELYWVDALTGQDLNRWFPLTSPSDFLFFLPPRKSVDSAKKLRLISSAARPSERPAIATRAYGNRSRSSPFWQRLVWGAEDGVDLAAFSDRSTRNIDRSTRTISLVSGMNSASRPNRRLDSSDHFRAIPLSDGYHILFTDPASGILCLGSDAPIGGPTKLLRKIWFEGPSGEESPTMYASGSDLTWGVRVVAAFGKGSEQSVWLYSVPLDIFKSDQNASNFSGTISSMSNSKGLNHTAWFSWWPKNGAQEWLGRTGDHVPGLSQHSVWPFKIRGQEIGKCIGVIDLAIDSGPSMTIWAFGKDGISTVWKLNNGRGEVAKEIIVVRDGTIREKDGEGDIQMVDLGGGIDFEGSNDVMESFDGASSLGTLSSSILKRKRRYDSSDYRSSTKEEDEGGFAWRYIETQRLRRRGYKRIETDFVTRVNIQIR